VDAINTATFPMQIAFAAPRNNDKRHRWMARAHYRQTSLPAAALQRKALAHLPPVP